MLNKMRSQAGFAIVEVLVATVVLAIGFIELATNKDRQEEYRRVSVNFESTNRGSVLILQEEYRC